MSSVPEDGEYEMNGWQDRDGVTHVLYLNGDGSERNLNVNDFANDFNPNYQFLVSRKYKKLPTV